MQLFSQCSAECQAFSALRAGGTYCTFLTNPLRDIVREGDMFTSGFAGPLPTPFKQTIKY